MKKTVIELRAMLAGLPDDMPVEFSPITAAYMGANHPLRVSDMSLYDAEGHNFALPDQDGAKVTIYISEDDSGEPRCVDCGRYEYVCSRNPCEKVKAGRGA